MQEPIYSYNITPYKFYCYVIQPDLEAYALMITDKIYYVRGGGINKEVSLDEFIIRFKFNEECRNRAKEWVNKYIKSKSTILLPTG